MERAIRQFLLLTWLGISGAVLAQGIEFHDITLIDRSTLQVLEPPEPLTIVRDRENRFEPASAPPSPDPTLARPSTRIGLDANALLDIPVERGSTLPGTGYLIEFQMAGQRISMIAIEARVDPDFDAVHMTLVAPGSDDYARLSISRAGPEIVGTFIIDDLRYRILPDSFNSEYQLVYPVARQGTGWRRDNPPDLDSASGRLEARHLQMAWVAENQPKTFLTLADGRLQSYRGEPSLGVLNFWDAVEFDAAGSGSVDVEILRQETERFLNQVQRFTWIYDLIEVQLEPDFETDLTTLSSNGMSIELYQLINGIPISRSLRLSMGPTGEVLQFSGMLMRLDMAETDYGARILQDEARETSMQSLLIEHGIESSGEFPDERLFYNVISDSELDLTWQMSVRANCGMTFSIQIDAISGEVERINAIDLTESSDLAERFRSNIFDTPFSRCRLAGRR